MLYDIINLILIVILGKQVYSYMDKNVSQMEHMDMSLFDTNGNYNPSTTTKSDLKSKLEKLEQSLLANVYYRKNKYLKERDEKAVFDVLSPPEQRVEERQYNYNINTGIRTRGEPDDYQLIGLLYNSTINKNYQLYGRRIYPGSYEWEYYIRGRDAGGLDFKFPLNYKQEFIDDNEIQLPIDNNSYKIKLYNYDQPRYNPYDIL